MSVKAIVALAILLLCTIGFIAVIVCDFVNKKRKYDHYVFPDEPLAEPVAVTATVLSKRIGIQRGGSVKLPHHTRVFYVTFLKDDDTTEEFPVTEEMFEHCIPDSTGTLVTIDGHFFDFGEGEDIP